MERWRINLIVLWFGQFLVMSGMTMVIPFLSLYLRELGLQDPHEIAFWTGIIFAGNSVTMFFFQPLWGGLADRYGRKMMLLRSGFGMAVVMTLMGFAQNAWQLLLLRMLNGTISGFQPAAVAMISANTPRDKIGFAMGTFQSGGVAGTILGPLIGGILAEAFGYRPIFYITGISTFISALLVLFLVKDEFNLAAAKARIQISMLASIKLLGKIPQLPALYTVTLMIQFALLSTLPIMPLFVEELHGGATLLAFYVGLVASIHGFSNMLSSPYLGRLSDKMGAERILWFCLIGAGLSYIPQALVQSVWQLMIARFIFGVFLGGLLPSVYSLIRKYTPEGMESRAYSLNSSTLSLGNMLGPIVGGAISGFITIRGVFIMSAFMLILNSFWVRKTLFIQPAEVGAKAEAEADSPEAKAKEAKAKSEAKAEEAKAKARKDARSASEP